MWHFHPLFDPGDPALQHSEGGTIGSATNSTAARIAQPLVAVAQELVAEDFEVGMIVAAKVPAGDVH